MTTAQPPRVAAGAIAAGALLALTACGAGGDAADASPQDGGTLRYGLSAVPICPDPQQASQNQAVYIARQVVDSLTDQDPETGEIVPWLAESWEVNPELTEFTFHLRDGVTFSDGTGLNAESVQKNFDAIAGDFSPFAPLGSSFLAGYAETRVDEDLTATVVFESPNAQFLQATSTFSLGLVADATLQAAPEDRCRGEVIGSGPFTFGEFVADQSVTVERRDGYAWGSSLFERDGEAYLEAIEFTVVPESGVRSGSLASDQLDAISDVLPQDEPAIEAADGTILTVANPGVAFGFQPNVEDPILSDPAVRAALIPAIDRQEIVDVVLGDRFHAATSPLAHLTPGWTDLSDRLGHDPQAAADQLEAAGWTEGADGIREKDGRPLRVKVIFGEAFSASQTVLELVQQQLKAVGVDLDVQQLPAADMTAATEAGDYALYFSNLSRTDPDILRRTFSTDFANVNRRGADAELDGLLEAQLSEPDTEARYAIVAEVQEVLLDRAYHVPLFELSQAIGTGANVHGLAFDASARLQFHDVWLAG
ncbi:ABC transporter substrate-binding protein [Glycomyces sp. NRRL B-16210]|uniref:ABC transporter substrate-binding protein n=1 Tax=Glycomyces sp. NRRL B-16210 TaxID=1463821 RepID=UPI0004C01578|nr:ABC transporter substrate-binding protein [Glycomyces sp. NRRL B-16210]